MRNRRGWHEIISASEFDDEECCSVCNEQFDDKKIYVGFTAVDAGVYRGRNYEKEHYICNDCVNVAYGMGVKK